MRLSGITVGATLAVAPESQGMGALLCQYKKSHYRKEDVNGDSRIGLAEAIHALQQTAGLR